MGLYRTVSEIDGDFSRELLKKIPTPVYILPLPPLTVFPLDLGIGAVVRKKPECWDYQKVQNFKAV